MRIVFMGTPDFAVPSLEALLDAHDVVLVVTRPDTASGRGRRLRPSPVKVAAEVAGVPVLQSVSLRGDARERVVEARPDVVCVAAFGVLLPPETLEIPPFGCINVHASLLPRHRGAAPVQRAILAGDSETGVSIMRMEEGLDTGPYALQQSVSIADRYTEEIEEDLAHVGARALLEVLECVADGSVSWTEQDDTRATYAAKITKDDVALEPELSVSEAFARVRAATRRAPARIAVGSGELTIVRAHPGTRMLRPGGISLVGKVPEIGFADGSLILDSVRPAGRNDMSADAWMRGARLSEGSLWHGVR